MERIALVTGAYRGLGFETVKELAGKDYRVILTCRDLTKGQAARKELGSLGERVLVHELDVTSPKSIDAIATFVSKELGKLHVLVNNAGILPHEVAEQSALEADIDEIRRAMETNTFGPFQLCQRFIPMMIKQGYGRVVNVSSGMGQLLEMNGGYAAYRLSKTALNAVTKIFSEEAKGHNVLVNSVCPGWVRTEMGGPNAHRSIPEGADTIVWAATLPDDGPTGGFFRDRKPLAW